MDDCPHESELLDGKKSFCELWKRWTNCREVGHCVYEIYGGGNLEPCQLTLNL